MTITPIAVPDDWDDNAIILFEEFCGLIRTPPAPCAAGASPLTSISFRDLPTASPRDTARDVLSKTEAVALTSSSASI